MTRSIMNVFLMFAVMLLNFGCIPNIPSPEELVRSIFNKQDDVAFLQYAGDKEIARKIISKGIRNSLWTEGYSDAIVLQKKIITTTDDRRSEHAQEAYVSQDFLNDEVAQAYKEAVLERGNSYKIYRSAVNKDIYNILGGLSVTYSDIQYYKYDLDFAIIEYDKNGRINTVLTRAAMFEKSSFDKRLGMKQRERVNQDIHIYLGGKARLLDMRLDNTLLTNNLLEGR